MLGLARYAMNGRRQAIVASMLSGMVPLLNLISPAIVALVLLRQGGTAAMQVAIWAVLPLLGWAWVGDLTPLILLLGVLPMAAVLRRTQSWQPALLVSLLVGAGSEVALRLRPGVLEQLQTQVGNFLAQSAADQPEISAELLQTTLISMFGVMHMMVVISCLIIARWWQARLYNPGGFQTEFHALKLQPQVAGLLLLLFLLAGLGPTALAGWAIYFSLPLLVAGIALVHGLVKAKGWSGFMLVAFYLMLMSPPIMQIVAVFALIDSFYDFRGRLTRGDDNEN